MSRRDEETTGPTPSAAGGGGGAQWFWWLLAVGAAGAIGYYARDASAPREISVVESAPPLPPPVVVPVPAVPALVTTNRTAIIGKSSATIQTSAPPAAAGQVTPLLSTSAAASPPSAPPAPTNAPQLIITQIVSVIPAGGVTQYNGIVLPTNWPPTNAHVAGEPMVVPYLTNPPPAIDISRGRQLFVDDFLIAYRSNVNRIYHQAELHTNNPVLKPETPSERAGKGPMAMPFSDGVWWDPWTYRDNPDFERDDLLNPLGIVTKFQARTNSPAIDHLWRLLPVKLQEELAGLDPGKELSDATVTNLIAGLNAVVHGPLLHQPDVFAGVTLTPQTSAWLGAGPKGAEVARLNRLLIEDVFRRETYREPAGFRAWYMAGYTRATAHATSSNGLDWVRTDLGTNRADNLVQTEVRDSSTVWLDETDADPRRRFKMFRTHSQNGWALTLHVSGDGLKWSEPLWRSGPTGDRTTVFYNPFRQTWVFSIRDPATPRKRRFWEMRDLLKDPVWKTADEPVLWVGADKLDPVHPEIGETPQLYNLDATPYESLLVGLFTVWQGNQTRHAGRPKRNQIFLGFSRDGFHWDRPDRRPFIPVSDTPGSWNWGNVQSVGGGFNVVGRELWFYFSGRAGSATNRDVNGAMGVATIRRDGFAEMRADGEGMIVTRPVVFHGVGYLFINGATNAPDGEIRVEVLHENGNMVQVIKNDTKEQFLLSKDNCVPLTADQTLSSVNWSNVPNLGMLIGKPVRFVFRLKNASLYSFWVGPSRFGRTHGPVAAGGPHFEELTDTVGNRSYRPVDYRPRPVAPRPTGPVPYPYPIPFIQPPPTNVVVPGASAR